MPTAIANIDDVLALFQTRGDSQYGGECVTQLEHALQAATLAEAAGATPELIAAALLHDVGHLLHELPDDAPEGGIDDRHEARGHRCLTELFPAAVCEPIRLHVPAKRYLCAIDAAYLQALSPPSIVSLELQGGPLSQTEVAAFCENPFAEDAVRLRRWDDQAKVPELPTPPLEHFCDALNRAAQPDVTA